MAPSFRSPPRIAGAVRTIRRYRAEGGGAVIAITVRDRAFADVLADMVEGVVVANRVTGAEAVRVRTALASALREPGAAAAWMGVWGRWRGPPAARGGRPGCVRSGTHVRQGRADHAGLAALSIRLGDVHARPGDGAGPPGPPPGRLLPRPGEVQADLHRAAVTVVTSLDALTVRPDVIHGNHPSETAAAVVRFP